MPRSLTVAAIQMDGSPAPTETRLERASRLIAHAASEGAKLIVLPEVFNTGLSYLETNYENTERLNDKTISWICEQAKKHGVHLVGSLMIVDKDDTYNAAFLVAPDGRQWRYNKQYPFLWERTFYRDGHGITIAETDLGKIGFLIGWDAAHEDIWHRYAAKVDILVVLHSQQDFSQASLRFPDGMQERNLGGFVHWFAESTNDYFRSSVEAQAQWLNVPIVVAGASGEFTSILPAPFFSTSALALLRPSLWESVDKDYAEILLEAPFRENTRIIDSEGKTIAKVETSGDSYVISSLELPEINPLPIDGMEQPQIEVAEMAFWFADALAASLLTLTYRRGLRRQWGAMMAQPDARTRLWFGLITASMILASLLTWLFSPKRKVQ